MRVRHTLGSINNVSRISEKKDKNVSLPVSSSAVLPLPLHLLARSLPLCFTQGMAEEVNTGSIFSIPLVLLTEAPVCFSEPEGFPLSYERQKTESWGCHHVYGLLSLRTVTHTEYVSSESSPVPGSSTVRPGFACHLPSYMS